MKNKHLIWCTILLCVVCTVTLGVLGMAEYNAGRMRVRVTVESRLITGVSGGTQRQLTLMHHDSMADDFVELAQNAPIWYVDGGDSAAVFFGARKADDLTVKACDVHGNVTQLRCAQNTFQLPRDPGQYTVGVWAQRGGDLALYAFRVHVVGV